jgi:hypothetical protein
LGRVADVQRADWAETARQYNALFLGLAAPPVAAPREGGAAAAVVVDVAVDAEGGADVGAGAATAAPAPAAAAFAVVRFDAALAAWALARLRWWRRVATAVAADVDDPAAALRWVAVARAASTRLGRVGLEHDGIVRAAAVGAACEALVALDDAAVARWVAADATHADAATRDLAVALREAWDRWAAVLVHWVGPAALHRPVRALLEALVRAVAAAPSPSVLRAALCTHVLPVLEAWVRLA